MCVYVFEFRSTLTKLSTHQRVRFPPCRPSLLLITLHSRNTAHFFSSPSQQSASQNRNTRQQRAPRRIAADKCSFKHNYDLKPNQLPLFFTKQIIQSNKTNRRTQCRTLGITTSACRWQNKPFWLTLRMPQRITLQLPAAAIDRNRS